MQEGAHGLMRGDCAGLQEQRQRGFHLRLTTARRQVENPEIVLVGPLGVAAAQGMVGLAKQLSLNKRTAEGYTPFGIIHSARENTVHRRNEGEYFVTQKQLKLFSWNVNGIRACQKKGFLNWLGGCKADIVMLQETKASPEQLPAMLCCPEGFHAEWCAAEKKGYSGVATFSRTPAEVSRGLGEARFDCEGRVLISAFPEFTLFNVYFPSGTSGSERVAFKLDFYRRFIEVVRAYIERGERIVVAGDVNTAYAEIDLARPRENRKTSGFLPEERTALGMFFETGLVDTFRYVRPTEAKYSWWSQVTFARERNIGWRLDYFLISSNLLPYVTDADIHPEVLGSDHCPVSLTLALP